MTKYTLKNPIVDAFQFQNDGSVELPSWAQSYTVNTALNGALKLSKDNLLGRLIVPTSEGHTFANVTDWLLYDGNMIRVMRDARFNELYEVVPVEALIPVVEPQPVIVNAPLGDQQSEHPVTKTLLATDGEPEVVTTAGPAIGPVDQGVTTVAQTTEPEQTTTEI